MEFLVAFCSLILGSVEIAATQLLDGFLERMPFGMGCGGIDCGDIGFSGPLAWKADLRAVDGRERDPHTVSCFRLD
jgi:hypothetical protein